jgi:ubiquinone/menaquinone biosynthesis C-methylase UbiE
MVQRGGDHTMTIDFHSGKIRGMYASRDADASWADVMRSIVDPAVAHIADIGCGGGIYSRAWSELGAATVVGVDFSAQMIGDARETSASHANLSFTQGDAANTGLPNAAFDIVFSRAVIHHLPDIAAAFTEAFRTLKPGGKLIVQDRTVEDVLHPASSRHLRGYFFEAFPRLLDVQRERRPDTASITKALRGSCFKHIASVPLAETRRTYHSLDELQDDLRQRTGRSILHALSDVELEALIAHISADVEGAFPIQERDYWTVWSAVKPGQSGDEISRLRSRGQYSFPGQPGY